MKRSSQVKKYPSGDMGLGRLRAKVVWDSSSALGVLDDPTVSKELFSEWWLGQIGVYKQERGSILKLNFFEILLLSEHFGLKVFDALKGKATTAKKIMESDFLHQLVKNIFGALGKAGIIPIASEETVFDETIKLATKIDIVGRKRNDTNKEAPYS